MTYNKISMEADPPQKPSESVFSQSYNDAILSLLRNEKPDCKINLKLLNVANLRKVSEIIAYILRDRMDELDNDVSECLRGIYLSAAAKNSIMLSAASKMTELLKSNGIKCIVLKGAVLSETVYPEFAMRRMADIDLLIRSSELEKALSVLNKSGMEINIKKALEIDKKNIHIHIPSFLDQNGVSFELHTRFINDQGTEEEYFERSEIYLLNGAEAYRLCDNDMLLHICIHAISHKFDRSLVPYYDIYLILNKSHVDVNAVLKKAERIKKYNSVCIALYIAQLLFKLQYDEKVQISISRAIETLDKETLAFIIKNSLGEEAVGKNHEINAYKKIKKITFKAAAAELKKLYFESSSVGDFSRELKEKVKLAANAVLKKDKYLQRASQFNEWISEK